MYAPLFCINLTAELISLKTKSMIKSILTRTNNLAVVIFCFSSMEILKSQTFNILPANTQTVSFICDSTKFQANVISISNPTTNPLTLSYTVVSNTLPQDGCWYYQFCDWFTCKMSLPSGTTNPEVDIPFDIPNTELNHMILDAITMNNKGVGSLVINLFERSNPSNSQIITWNVTGCLTGNECTSYIPEFISESNVSIYPNPSANTITIDLDNASSINSLKVFNVLGKNVISEPVNKAGKYELDISKLNNGVYLIVINTAHGTVTKKFMKS